MKFDAYASNEIKFAISKACVSEPDFEGAERGSVSLKYSQIRKGFAAFLPNIAIPPPYSKFFDLKRAVF